MRLNLNRFVVRICLAAFLPGAIMGLGAGLGAAHAQEGAQARRDRLARRIEARVQTLHALDRERANARERRARALEQVQAQAARLQRQLEPREAALERTRARVEALEGEVEAAEAQRAALVEEFGELSDAAGAIARRYRRWVAAALPRERGEREKPVAALMEAFGEEAPEAPSDLWVLMGQSLRHAATRELWNAPVELEAGERRVQAYQARLGLLMQVFVSEDGRTVGLFRPGEEVPRLVREPAARRGLEAVVEMLRDRRPPGIVSVPVPVTPGEEGTP